MKRNWLFVLSLGLTPYLSAQQGELPQQEAWHGPDYYNGYWYQSEEEYNYSMQGPSSPGYEYYYEDNMREPTPADDLNQDNGFYDESAPPYEGEQHTELNS